MFSHSHQVMPVKDDGFCFLNAIDLVPYCDYNEVVTVDSLASHILGHLADNVDYYKWFHTGDVFSTQRVASNLATVVSV